MKPDATTPPKWQQAIAWLAVLALLAAALALVFVRLAPRTRFDGIWEYRRLFLDGWLWTLGLSAAGLLLACVMAPLWAFLKLSRFAALRAAASFAVEILRGTPFLVLLLVGFYVVADALGLDNRIGVGVFLLSLYHGAYLGEMLRGGIDSIARTQHDAARAVGFDPIQTFTLIILPQALRRILPGLAGQAITLVKDSALLSVVGIMELTKQAQSASSLTFSTFEAYLPMAAGYLVLTLPLAWMSRELEGRMRHED